VTVVELVERERSRLRRLYVLAGAALAIGATCALLAAAASALGGARWIGLPRGTPFLVWLGVIIADAAVVVWTIRRLDRRATRHSVAAAIEREQLLRAGSLRGVIEVAESGALGRRAAATLSERLGPKAGKLAVGERRLVRRGAAQATGAATMAVAALAFAVPNFNDGMLAIFEPVSAWKGTLLPHLAFENLPPDVLRGETVRIRISAPRRTSVSLSQRVPGEAWRTQTLIVDPRTGIASVEVGPLRGDLRVVASDGRSASDTGLVHVTDRPFVGAVSMRATYPSYLARPAEGLPIGEPAKVPQGTVIDVAGRASAALRSVRLAASGDTVNLNANDRVFSGRFAARHTGRYTWLAAGTTGPIADVPAPVELEVVPDSAPRVDIVSPQTDTLVAGDDRITLHATATDDHGLAMVEIMSWASSWVGQRAPILQRAAESAGTVWNGTSTLDLGQLKLHPGDALHVKFVATDNSPWSQHGESRELLLKIPTLEERRAIVRDAMDSAVSQVKATAAAEKSLQERTTDAARDRQRTPADAPPPTGANGKQGNMTYEAAEKAKAVAKDQRELADQVKNLQQTAAAIEQQLKQAGVLDTAIQRQLQEAQAMLRDALTPELLAQMQKLENATQQLSKEQSQQSLKDLQAMQQRLREQLEKSAEMLKRAALEGSMETLKDEAKDIAQKDKALADSAAAKQTESQKRDAKQLADRSQRFSDEVKKLQERLDNAKADAGANGAKEAKQHADASQEAMRQAASDQQKQQAGQQQNGQQQANGQPQPNGQPQSGQQSNPQSGQQQNGQQNQQNGQKGGGLSQNAQEAASQMERASDAMKQARAAQVGEWKSELTNALDQAVQDMLQMARQEQSLEQQARSGQSKPEDLRGAQSAVKQGLDNAAQRLQQEGQKS